MSNTNYVCFSCRTAVRRPKRYFRPQDSSSPRCSQCSKPCVELSDRILLPSKHKTKEWQKLQQDLWRQQLQILEIQQRSRVRYKHELEHEADRLERKLQEPMHPQTAKQLKRLLKNCLKKLEQVLSLIHI